MDPKDFEGASEGSEQEESPEASPEPGVTEEYAPQYPIISCIGTGERVGTYLCQDPLQEGNEVIQKLVSEETSREIPDLVDLHFSHLSRLAHPNLPAVLDFGWEGDRAFLVTERAGGRPILEAATGISLDQVLTLISQLLLTLDYLHRQNVLHLDLKPQNVLVSPTPRGEGFQLKLVDYGLAALFHTSKAEGSNAVGTAPFIDPEYALNPHPDPRFDLYSVGVLCYAALCGRLPFEGGDPVALVQAQLKKEPPSLKKLVPGISPQVVQWVERMMVREKKKKFSGVRAALQELWEAWRKAPPEVSEAVLPLYSNPEEVFREKEFRRMFRRIALQGRRWAFEGKRGSGKTFFARWLQRFFWINAMPVHFFHGEEISLLIGEKILNPAKPVFVIVDDADQGPSQAWLEARPYQHVVVFGQELTWAKRNPQWQCFPVEDLDVAGVKSALEGGLGPLDEREFQDLAKRNRGNCLAMVQQVRALDRMGMVQRMGEGGRLLQEKYPGILGKAQGTPFGWIIPSLPEETRALMALLALAQVPVVPEKLAQWLESEVQTVRAGLVRLVQEDLVSRRVWMGREYYQSLIPIPDRLDTSLKEFQTEACVQHLWEEGWHEAGINCLERLYTPEEIQKIPRLTLMRAKLMGGVEKFGEVVKSLGATFVKTLPPSEQAEAFEILGEALFAMDRNPQAEAAFKNAFNQYRAEKNTIGQAKVLNDLGAFSHATSDQNRALKFLQQALSLAEKSPEGDGLQGRIELNVARLYAEATDFEKAEERYLKSIEKFLSTFKTTALPQAYYQMALMHFQTGEYDRSESYCREALGWALFKRMWRTQGDIFSLWAELEEQNENPAGALQRLNEAVFAYSKISQGIPYLKALVHRAYVSEANRQLGPAERDAQQALRLAGGLKAHDLLGKIHLILGKIRRRDIKKLDLALKQFDLAAAQIEHSSNPDWGWEVEFERGEIERNQGNNAAARNHYNQALRHMDLYLGQVTPGRQERFLKDGKRNRVETAKKWIE